MGDLNIKKQTKKIHQKYGKSYFFATRFFPKEIRRDTSIMYAFFRLPDDVIDLPGVDPVLAERELREMWIDWEDAYNTNRKDPHDFFSYAASILRAHKIPFLYTKKFYDAMIQDAHVSRYETLTALEEYMEGSAAAVGYIMSYIIGFDDEKTLRFAKKLGQAMQRTNFLRDMGEDVRLRNRIYAPLERLAHFGVTYSDIESQKMSASIKKYVESEIHEIRMLYREAHEGIALLNARGRRAVRIASRLYEEILHKIEMQGYDVFSRRAHTSLPEKIRIVLKEHL